MIKSRKEMEETGTLRASSLIASATLQRENVKTCARFLGVEAVTSFLKPVTARHPLPHRRGNCDGDVGVFLNTKDGNLSRI